MPQSVYGHLRRVSLMPRGELVRLKRGYVKHGVRVFANYRISSTLSERLS
jgi:hypothetical protein